MATNRERTYDPNPSSYLHHDTNYLTAMAGISRILFWLGNIPNIHRRSVYANSRGADADWESCQEWQTYELKGLPRIKRLYLAPACLALVRLREIKNWTFDASEAMHECERLDGTPAQAKSLVALEMVHLSIGGQDIEVGWELRDPDNDLRTRRRKAIEMTQHLLTRIEQYCGAHLLEALAQLRVSADQESKGAGQECDLINDLPNGLLDEVRAAVIEKGKDAKPNAICRVVKKRGHLVRAALRQLETKGEYEGFKK